VSKLEASPSLPFLINSIFWQLFPLKQFLNEFGLKSSGIPKEALFFSRGLSIKTALRFFKIVRPSSRTSQDIDGDFIKYDMDFDNKVNKKFPS
jgi:hypothetical protein